MSMVMPSISRRLLFISCSLIYLAFGTTAPVLAEGRFGEFSGNPQGELSPDGKSFELQKDFAFRDDKGRVWLVPAIYTTDGASIPWPFWSFIGSPLTGLYRYAAIIHDYFCDRRAYSWEEVHSVFYKG